MFRLCADSEPCCWSKKLSHVGRCLQCKEKTNCYLDSYQRVKPSTTHTTWSLEDACVSFASNWEKLPACMVRRCRTIGFNDMDLKQTPSMLRLRTPSDCRFVSKSLISLPNSNNIKTSCRFCTLWPPLTWKNSCSVVGVATMYRFFLFPAFHNHQCVW